jgi:hypothetical protein
MQRAYPSLSSRTPVTGRMTQVLESSTLRKVQRPIIYIALAPHHPKFLALPRSKRHFASSHFCAYLVQFWSIHASYDMNSRCSVVRDMQAVRIETASRLYRAVVVCQGCIEMLSELDSRLHFSCTAIEDDGGRGRARGMARV